MRFFFIYFIFWKILSVFSAPDVEKLPPVFYFEDYDTCLLDKENATYCTFTFQIQPNNFSKTWIMIEKMNLNPKNYRHDILRHGICIDLEQNVGHLYNEKYSYLGLKGQITKIHCEKAGILESMDSYDIIYLVFISLYIVFVLIASSVSSSKWYGKILMAFSLPNNFLRLSSINHENEDQKSLSCIQGVRFYNMLCVILAHTIMVQFGTPLSNPSYTEKIHDNFLNILLTNGGYVVQTFFLISGWLLMYNVLKALGTKPMKLKDVITIIITRYFRLTPTLAMVLFFHCTLLIHLSQGPFWHKIIYQEYLSCRQNWWTNLLYINNLVHHQNMCLQQTWYLATDMQLFVAFLILIYFMKRFAKFSKIFLGLAIFSGILIQGILSYVNEYDILIRQFPEALYNYLLELPQWHVMYSAPYSNITGYGIGVLFGLIFYNLKAKNCVKTKLIVIAWWILSFGLPLFIILIAGRMYHEEYKYTKLEAAFYWGFGKLIFALGLAIGILGMTQNIGWLCVRLCRWYPVQILGRLTFSAYLIHVTLIKLRLSLNHQTIYISDALFFYSFLGDVTVSYLAATILTLFVEMPLSALQKLLVDYK